MATAREGTAIPTTKREVLIVDKPYASVLMKKFLHMYCYHCYKRCFNLKPCNDCAFYPGTTPLMHFLHHDTVYATENVMLGNTIAGYCKTIRLSSFLSSS
ncbi:hypothetical protein TcWFU_000034 [Taenia crassiceps]|uniref:Uncharacterized protein n=1 Tax=Taenia crassiceps TaxID=6207 RepID=A0ABR4QJ85_9CEST